MSTHVRIFGIRTVKRLNDLTKLQQFTSHIYKFTLTLTEKKVVITILTKKKVVITILTEKKVVITILTEKKAGRVSPYQPLVRLPPHSHSTVRCHRGIAHHTLNMEINILFSTKKDFFTF